MKEIERRLKELEQRKNGGGPGGWEPWEPSPDEADAILMALYEAGGIELVQSVIEYQENGVFRDGNDNTD